MSTRVRGEGLDVVSGGGGSREVLSGGLDGSARFGCVVVVGGG